MIDTDSIAPGIIVQHILQKEWVMVLSWHTSANLGTIIKCRTKKLEVIEFYSFELELIPLSEGRKGNRSNAKG